MRRILVIGIAAALLIGVLVATATASVEQTVEGVDDSPMTIPSGKIGDRTVYAMFFDAPEAHVESASSHDSSGSSGTAKASASSGSSDELRPAGVETILIERVGKSVDQSHRIHDVAVIRSNVSYGEFESTSVQYVELAKRSLVRSDWKYENNFGFAETFATSSFHEPGGTPFFEHQGKTYALGDELPGPGSEDFCFGGFGMTSSASAGLGGLGNSEFRFRAMAEECHSEWAPEILEFRSWVAERGTVDGHDAYMIRTESTMRVPEIVMTASGDGSSSTSVSRHLTVRVVSDEWVTADVPYPLLEESVAYMIEDGEEKESGRSQRVLQLYEEGSAPIQWKDVPLPPLPVLERSADALTHPGDGTNSKLPYKLSTALADVSGMLAPPSFAAWRQLHPTAALVSAQHSIGENSRSAQPSYMWILVFAEPSGAGYQVGTERIGSLGQPFITDRGEIDVGAFEASDVPHGLVTIAEVEHAWSVLAPESYTTAGINYVLWGLQVDYDAGPTCLGSSSGNQPEDAAAELRTIYVGRVSFGSCMESSSDIVASMLAYDVDDAELLMLLEVKQSFDMMGADVQPRGADVKTESTMAGVKLAKPDIAVATVTSSSLLAIFLAAYFLPAMKVVGAQALLLMPGYAKLRKGAILDNKIRDQILDTIKQDPGVSITDLAKKVDAGWGTVVYHLGVLEKNKMVSTVLDGRHRRAFPVGLVDFTSQGQLALLQNERVRALYELIHDEPGVIQDQLAKRIGISAPATSWHLKRLEDAGLVGRVKDGRRVHYYANQKPEVHTPDGMEVA